MKTSTRYLASTLGRDDYVDLNSLRVVPRHPHFDRYDLETPTPAPAAIPDPAKPVLVLPEPPRGFAGFFGKKKHVEAVEIAQEAHKRDVAHWKAQCKDVEVRRQVAKNQHVQAEAERIATPGSRARPLRQRVQGYERPRQSSRMQGSMN